MTSSLCSGIVAWCCSLATTHQRNCAGCFCGRLAQNNRMLLLAGDTSPDACTPVFPVFDIPRIGARRLDVCFVGRMAATVAGTCFAAQVLLMRANQPRRRGRSDRRG